MFRRTAFAAPLALLCCAVSAESQTVLTVDRVLDLAARQNPEVLLARARIGQAEGSLITAQSRLATNPEVDLFLGHATTRSVGDLPNSSSRSSKGSSLVASAAIASPRRLLASISGRSRSRRPPSRLRRPHLPPFTVRSTRARCAESQTRRWL